MPLPPGGGVGAERIGRVRVIDGVERVDLDFAPSLTDAGCPGAVAGEWATRRVDRKFLLQAT